LPVELYGANSIPYVLMDYSTKKSPLFGAFKIFD